GLRVLENAARAAAGPAIGIDYAGESRQMRLEGAALSMTLVFAVILIYLVLAAQFRSFRDPLVVLIGSVPLAISGALVFTFLKLTTINIYSQVGLITLVGLVAKNGILIVEFANHLQQTGLSKFEAVKQAAATRLRPILMTSAATVYGHFPLVLVTGAGAGPFHESVGDQGEDVAIAQSERLRRPEVGIGQDCKGQALGLDVLHLACRAHVENDRTMAGGEQADGTALGIDQDAHHGDKA